jgi:hypothetical protein
MPHFNRVVNVLLLDLLLLLQVVCCQGARHLLGHVEHCTQFGRIPGTRHCG